jgi:hypothetical protein
MLQENLGCISEMIFRGRRDHKLTAINHVQSFLRRNQKSKPHQEIGLPQQTSTQSDSRQHRQPYLVVVGTSGSGKSRFLCEVGNELQERNNYLVLACTFNHDTCHVPEDTIGVDTPQFPVVARLLYQYARKSIHSDWSSWCHQLINLNNTYNFLSFLELLDVVNFLKVKYSKAHVVLLIDETYRFIQNGIFNDAQTRSLMRKIVSIQDHGVPVLFSAFVAILVNEEGWVSSRKVEILNMTELSCDDMSCICKSQSDKLTKFSIALGLTLDRTMKLLYSCIGGLPRILEGLYVALQSLRHYGLLTIIDAVGNYIGSRYPPPPFELIMVAFSNRKHKLNSKIGTGTIRFWSLIGYCYPEPILDSILCSQTSEGDQEISIRMSDALLFAAVYSTTSDATCPNEDLRIIFRHILKEFLLIPIIKPYNIWDEFVRRLVMMRSLHYHISSPTPTNISLGELFNPAIELRDCLRNTRIEMKTMHLHSIRYLIPPSPSDVTRIGTPSIWFPDSQMESGVDTLLFFNRAPVPSSTTSSSSSATATAAATNQAEEYEREETVHGQVDPSNLICVGIQNKWYSDDQTKITYSAMRNAINHFISKMKVRDWNDSQLYFIFILNPSIYDYVEKDLSHYFDEQIGIISATHNMLEEWLSPTLKTMIQRYQTLAKHSPNHEMYCHEMTADQMDGYEKASKIRFGELTLQDQENPDRQQHISMKEEQRQKLRKRIEAGQREDEQPDTKKQKHES